MANFNAIAFAYSLLIDETKRWATEGPWLSELVAASECQPPRVLDVGCGTGFHARHIAHHLGCEVVGIDPAPDMLEAAAKHEGGSRVAWQQGDAATPPTGPFDLILLLGNTISLIERPDAVFSALGKVASNGGLLLIQTLDYERLRRSGRQERSVSRGGVRVTKVLEPSRGSPRMGASLTLHVTRPDGSTIAEHRDTLYDHSTADLIGMATVAGWSLTERRSSYDDQLDGPDRIMLFERSMR
jgi:SAM-dependent methyltransferase